MAYIYLASNNAFKIQELEYYFSQLKISEFSLHTAQAIGGMPFVDEVEDTYLGNAKLKAYALAKNCPAGAYILSDDSGLEVDALCGKPGVHSAYFAGKNANAKENNLLLLKKLEGIPPIKRTARLICYLFLLEPLSKKEYLFDGSLEGTIHTHYPPGTEDAFGYTPVFIPKGYHQPLAFFDKKDKLGISHRAQAAYKMITWLMHSIPKKT